MPFVRCFLFSAVLLILVACSGATVMPNPTTNPPADPEPTSPGDAPIFTSSEAFPSNLAIVSPFKQEESNSELNSSGPKRRAFATAAAQVDAILNGDIPIRKAFNPYYFMRLAGDAPCFGPSILYDYLLHPDYSEAPSEVPSEPEAIKEVPEGAAMFPGGDLGIWLSTTTVGKRELPCSAAQLNAQIEGAEKQGIMALMVFAALVRTAQDNGYDVLHDPSSVSFPLDLKAEMNAHIDEVDPFEQASIDKSGDTFIYDVTFNFPERLHEPKPETTADVPDDEDEAKRFKHTFTMHLEHSDKTVVTTQDEAPESDVPEETEPSSPSVDRSFSGSMWYRVTGTERHFPGGNCRAPIEHKEAPVDGPDEPKAFEAKTLHHRTLNGSLLYKMDEGKLAVQSRTGTFCEWDADTNSFLKDVNGIGDDGQVDASMKYTHAPDSKDLKGWGENFNIFAANFSPSDMNGDYSYLWQAGSGDGWSRVFNVHIEDATGDAWYGYGDDVEKTDGSIKGMFCNWAGPGAKHGPDRTPSSYVQYQQVSGGDDGLSVVSEKINYAPTNSCTYIQSEGDKLFRYDDDADQSLEDETADTVQVKSVELDDLSNVTFLMPDVPGRMPGTP